MNGHTSVAPILGCAPTCLVISINSEAFLIPLKAATITFCGSPTKVTTVLFVSFPGSTSSKRIPSTDIIASVIALIIDSSLPSLKFGTHSIIFIQ